MLLILADAAFGEAARQGSLVKVTREAPLFKEASSSSRKFGYLPPGSLVTLKGDKSDDFVFVNVELEKDAIDGWIRAVDLDLSEEESLEDALPTEGRSTPFKKKNVLRKKRLNVPQDEGLLIRRDQTFVYGVHGSGNYAMLSDSADNPFSGYGYSAGAHFGIFITPTIPLFFEATYLSVNTLSQATSGAMANKIINVNYFDFGATVAYWYSNFEITASASYSYAMGVSDVPSTVTFGSVSELSTLLGGAGLGYRLRINDVSAATVRAKYAISVARTPIALQIFAIQLALDFSG